MSRAKTETPDEKPPGLNWVKRRNGAPVAYWRAQADLIRKGYRPKSVRLHYAPDDPMLARRCFALQAEMLEWSRGRSNKAAEYDGTFASLHRFYETHPESPFRELRMSRRQYSTAMKKLMENKGKRRVDAVTGLDIKRWYKELCETTSKGWAYFTINVLKAVLSFGASANLADCIRLRAAIGKGGVKFSAGKRRQEFLTFEMVVRLCAAAPKFKLQWFARCLLLQFELGFRRRDVIGIYAFDPGAEGAISSNGMVWQDGLTWHDIDRLGVLTRVVSKTRDTSGKTAVHQIDLYPLLKQELDRTPSDQRVGPLVINPKTGMPPTEAQARRAFRTLAREVGIPDHYWNADARAGANTEADNAGAAEADKMDLLSHTSAQTNARYTRDQLEASRRVAAKRQARRGSV